MSALGGEAPQGTQSASLLCFLPHDLAGAFVHWALGLGGLVGALGARPAALSRKGILGSFAENLDEVLDPQWTAMMGAATWGTYGTYK